MDRQVLSVAAAPPLGERENHREAEAADEHADRDDAEHPGVCRKGRETADVGHKPGVGEGRRGEVEALPHRRPRVEALQQQSWDEEHGQRRLDREHADGDCGEQAANFAKTHRLTFSNRACVDTQRVAVAGRHKFRLEAESAGNDEPEQAGGQRKKKKKKKKKKKDGNVAKCRPVRRHVHGGQPCDTDR